MVVFDHSDFCMAFCSFDVGGDFLQELQLGRFSDAIPVIKDALQFNDQAMFYKLVKLPDGIFRNGPGGEIDPGRTCLLQ